VDIFLPVESSLSTLLIHTDAVFLKNGKPCVYKIVEGKVELIHIKTGLKEKETVEIKEGLLEGDKIVLYGQNRLYPGLDVEIKAP
jgi:membrane fusion protein (multidrug efflux system)